MKTIILDAKLQSIFEEATAGVRNPLLTVASWIFTDDKPNANKQGIKVEEFDDIIANSVDMPIKMRYQGEAKGHLGSVTIGHIRSMTKDTLENGTNVLKAEGVLYKGEYPKEVEYLQEALANGEAPGCSWELNYTDEEIDGPIQWLKGIITKAATFVKFPAYGNRTKLLALASDENISDDELSQELSALAQEIRPKNDNKGGSNKVTEEEIKALQDQLEALQKQNETLTTANAELETTNTELKTDNEAKDAKIAEYEKKELVASRTAQAQEAGLVVEDSELAAKQEFWASMSEQIWTNYLADIKKVAAKPDPKKTAAASARITIPRPDATASAGSTESVTPEMLKATFRNRNRNPQDEE